MPKTVRKIEADDRKSRSIKLSKKNWVAFANLKPRDKSWELFIEELVEAISFFKKM